MTDEECMSAWAKPVYIPAGENSEGKALFSTMFIEYFMPSKEDIEAINAGRRFWYQVHQPRLSPHAVFTLDENGLSNDAG